MVQQIPALTWSATVIATGPVAPYTVDFSIDPRWQFLAMHGTFGTVDTRPKFVTIDNYINDQVINVQFGAIPFPIGAFQRLTIPVPTTAIFMEMTTIGNLPVTVLFALDDLSRSDGINFKGISASAAGSSMQPIDYLGNGNVNITTADLGRIKVFAITALSAINLPLAASVGNGFPIEVWNESASSANAVPTTSGADVLNDFDGSGDVATYPVVPGAKLRLVSDGVSRWGVEGAAAAGASFTSAQQAIVVAGTFTVAHGLGAKPIWYAAYLQNVTAELGYTAGDEVRWDYSATNQAGQFGVVIVPDATNVVARYALTAPSFWILRKDTGALGAVTIGNWRVVIRARL